MTNIAEMNKESELVIEKIFIAGTLLRDSENIPSSVVKSIKIIGISLCFFTSLNVLNSKYE